MAPDNRGCFREWKWTGTTTMEKERAGKLLKKCTGILKKEGIPVSENIGELVINSRAKARFGKCTNIKGMYQIEVSSELFQLEDKPIETVILHELLHTCRGCMNHGKRWKQYAAVLNETYGYEITAKTSYEHLGLKTPESRESVKYMVVCCRCGAQFPRKRMCSLVENVDRYRCGKCGGNLEIH